MLCNFSKHFFFESLYSPTLKIYFFEVHKPYALYSINIPRQRLPCRSRRNHHKCLQPLHVSVFLKKRELAILVNAQSRAEREDEKKKKIAAAAMAGTESQVCHFALP